MEIIKLFSRYLQRFWGYCLLRISYISSYIIYEGRAYEEFLHVQSFILLLLHEGRTLYVCFIAVSSVALCGDQGIKRAESLFVDWMMMSVT